MSGAQETKGDLRAEINPFASTALSALTLSATNNGKGTIAKLGGAVAHWGVPCAVPKGEAQSQIIHVPDCVAWCHPCRLPLNEASIFN